MATTVNCPACGKLTDPRLDHCPHCGYALSARKPAAGPAAPRAGARACPSCGAMVQPTDIICVACGTNLLTGQKLAAPSKRTASTGSSTKWMIAAGVAALVAILAGVIWLYVASRDPVEQATALAGEGEVLRAIDVLTAHLENAPDDDRAYYHLGLLLHDTDQYVRAAEAFRRAAEINPANQDAAIWAIVSMGAANPNAANLGQQIALLERAVDSDPDNPSVLYLLALARGASGDIDGQIAALERVVRLQPTDTAVRMDLGIGYALRGRYQDARRQLAQVGPGQQESGKAFLLGVLDLKEGNGAEAAGHLNESIEAEAAGTNEDALTLLGRLLIQQGQFREAENYLDRAIQANTNNATARFFHAVALHAQGKTGDALTEYDALVRQGGNFAAQAAVEAAKIYLDQGDPDAAMDSLDRAHARGAEGAAYQTVSGRTQLLQGQTSAAKSALDTAIRLDPGYAPAYLELGLLHVKTQNFDPAVRNLHRYLELVGDDSRDVQAYPIRELINQLVRAGGVPQSQAGI